ncbi:hypothetical protein ACHWQZ_G017425 [Mnemiopsis leidyi]
MNISSESPINEGRETRHRRDKSCQSLKIGPPSKVEKPNIEERQFVLKFEDPRSSVLPRLHVLEVDDQPGPSERARQIAIVEPEPAVAGCYNSELQELRAKVENRQSKS